MLAGADCIDDLDVLRHGAMSKVFAGVRAPSTLGTFLRSFTFGHLRQLDAVAARTLAGLAGAVPRLLVGATGPGGMAFVDVDDTIRQVHGYNKQGAAYGYCGVKGLNAQIAALSSPTCAPVIAASWLRKGNVVSGHGADRLIADAVVTARAAGVSGQMMVRADSGYYRRDVIAAALRAKAWFSVTVRMNPQVRQAITGIPEQAWTTIKYPRAIWDDQEQRFISEAEVAKTTFTAFTSYPKKRQITCRLVVRRVHRLNKATIAAAQDGQGELFATRRHHGFITNSALPVVEADEIHRDHAIVEQVIAELKDHGYTSAANTNRERQPWAPWRLRALMAGPGDFIVSSPGTDLGSQQYLEAVKEVATTGAGLVEAVTSSRTMHFMPPDRAATRRRSANCASAECVAFGSRG